MFIPIIALVISSVVLVNNVLTTGFIMDKSVELSGGKVVSFDVSNVNLNLTSVQKAIPFANVYVTEGAIKTIHVEFPYEMNTTDVIDKIKPFVSNADPSIREIGPIVGSIFFQQAQFALIMAFVLMSIIVFILFRSPAPSIIVIFAVVTDMIVTIAILSFLDVQFSLITLGGLLMLIGYSVDTDILLTSEVLKSGSNVKESIRAATKTGLTLTTTVLVALFAIYFLGGNVVLEQIALILIIGLVTDIFATWLTNAGILRWWVERHANKS